jgi:hypothetical protein
MPVSTTCELEFIAKGDPMEMGVTQGRSFAGKDSFIAWCSGTSAWLSRNAATLDALSALSARLREPSYTIPGRLAETRLW